MPHPEKKPGDNHEDTNGSANHYTIHTKQYNTLYIINSKNSETSNITETINTDMTKQELTISTDPTNNAQWKCTTREIRISNQPPTLQPETQWLPIAPGDTAPVEQLPTTEQQNSNNIWGHRLHQVSSTQEFYKGDASRYMHHNRV